MNYYEILGITENTSQVDIKKAYRALSLKHHPDKQGGNEEEFKKINEAYTVLSDPEKKREYDISLKSGTQHFNFNQQPTPTNVGDVFNMMFNNEGFSNFIKVNLEKVAKNMSVKKPVPIVTTIELNFQQSYDGCTYPLKIDRFIINNTTSDEKTYENETVYVTIPPGTDDNEIIVVQNKGNAIGENYGDIKCCIKINNNTQYIRQGMDLFYKKQLSLKEALCGFSFTIQHLDGKTYNINNTVGRIISPGMKQIIPKLGMHRGETVNYGNLIIDFEIKFPEVLSPEQKDAIVKIL